MRLSLFFFLILKITSLVYKINSKNYIRAVDYGIIETDKQGYFRGKALKISVKTHTGISVFFFLP